MKDRMSSNLALSATQTSVFTDSLEVSAPTENISAPSVEMIDLGVEGPNSKSIEMIHEIKCVNGNGNIATRWYVEYYITDSQTNKRLRKREYGGINKSKDPDERLKLLFDLKLLIISNLQLTESKKNEFEFDNSNSITFYINEYLRCKVNVLDPVSVKAYKNYLTGFHLFLKKRNVSHHNPHTITKQFMFDYRQHLSEYLTNRGVNNHIDGIKGFFSYLIKRYENVLIKNPCEALIKLQSKSETHVAYSKKQALEISEHLKIKDLQLLQYCRFVGYGFLRCKETRNLKIGDINFDNKTITLPAGNVKSKVRIVKPMLLSFFEMVEKMDLKNYPSTHYVFSPNGKPGIKRTCDCYFRKKYKHVKKHFKLNNYYTIYSFRHTMVCELLDSNAPWHEIMKYTGHTTMASFEKYARSILNKPATDLSSHININF